MSERDRLEHEAQVETSDGARSGTAAPPHGPSLTADGVTLLQRLAGNRATSAAVRAAGPLRRAGRALLARLGTALDQPLPAGAEVPAYGEDKGDQRRYSRAQFEAMWEAEQGRKLTWQMRETIKAGCIGITSNNLGKYAGPALTEVYSTYAKAKAAADAYNAGLPRYESKPYAVYGMHFWSNQDPDATKRASPNPAAFLPDGAGKVDMTGYEYRARPGYTNFDFGWLDEVSASYWHANHYEAGPADPMKVYQSTPAKFSEIVDEGGETRFGYPDFDREVFGVERSLNYDPTKARKPKLTSPRLMGADGKPEPTIERVFRGKTTLQLGSPPAAVKIVQQVLVDSGYDLGDYGPGKDGVDGKYGTKTSDAIKQFKVDHNLGAQSKGSTDRGVIYRIDDLFPP